MARIFWRCSAVLLTCLVAGIPGSSPGGPKLPHNEQNAHQTRYATKRLAGGGVLVELGDFVRLVGPFLPADYDAECGC